MSEPGPPATAGTRHAVEESFLTFVREECVPLIRFLIRTGASLPDSQSAAQEAFTAACELLGNRPSAWAAIANQRAWIRTVARRALTRPPGRHRRRAQPVTLPPFEYVNDEAWSWTEDDAVDRVALDFDVRRALSGLPEPQRLVMVYAMDGFTTQVIAVETGMPEPRAARLLALAKAAMKAALSTHSRSRKGSP